MSESVPFPDFAALQQLARALWRNGSARGAALLVGAGITKSCSVVGEDTPKPPLWGDLLEKMIGRLYASASKRAPTNPLRIAEEYRTYFGQAALDDFLREHFPDRAWQPAVLHTELLGLPWSDVLTTNWDTVLERAAENARDTSYEVVRYETDIPHARSPRIIKLHGSLGDADPLIFAEEDYRTYPDKHAAFVNLARQIFIENELCLLGFSGDDPNFMQWAGWVRDRLGDGVRRIYLVGNLDLPPVRRKYFEAHNIAPIDFAPLTQDVPEGERHTEATRLFIAALKREQPTPEHEWSLAPPETRPLQQAGHTAFEQVRKNDAFAADLLDKTASVFTKDRQSYPGWLVCPRKYRERLGHGVEEAWLVRKTVLDRFQPSRRAEILWELAWRRTVAFLPLDTRLMQAIAELLQAPDADIDADRRYQFAVVLMRYARFCEDGEALVRWGKMIDSEVPPHSPYRTEVLYQRCLHARDRLDIASLSEDVQTLNSGDPVWQIRRATLLAEIGEHTVATKLINDATNSLDKEYRLIRTSLSVKSRLGWADWISRGADLSNFPKSSDAPRSRDFKDVLVDPHREIAAITEGAAAALLREREEDREIIPLFDPGHYRDARKSIDLGGVDRAVLLRYELDQLIEFAGFPIRINHVSLCGEAALGAARITFNATVIWYLRLLRALPSHFDKVFDRYFGRIAIAQLSSDVSTSLIRTVRRALSYWWGRVKLPYASERRADVSYAIDQARLYVMVLSRLTVRMPPSEAKEVFFYAHDLVVDATLRHAWLLEALAELARCAAAAIPPSEQGEVALACIEFPLPSEKGYNYRLWSDPLQAIWDSTPRRSLEDAQWSQRIQQLLSGSKKGKPERQEAIFRLAYLALRHLLSSDEQAAFASALWSDVDDEENALPAGTGLLQTVFAQLPTPAGIDVERRLQNRIFGRDPLEPPTDSTTLRIPPPREDEAHLIAILNSKLVGLKLNADRAAEIFDRLTSWRPAAVNTLDPLRASIAKESGERLRQYIGDALRQIVVPAMTSDARTEARARVLLDFVHAVKAWRALPCLIYFLATAPSLLDEVKDDVERGLVAYDHYEVTGAATALVTWAKVAPTCTLIELPRSLIEKLLTGIEIHHKRGVMFLLEAARQLVAKGLMQDKDISRLVKALSDLRTETAYANIRLDSDESAYLSLVRAECVRLASALHTRGANGDTLLGWIGDAPSDPLPEVRFSLSAAPDGT